MSSSTFNQSLEKQFWVHQSVTTKPKYPSHADLSSRTYIHILVDPSIQQNFSTLELIVASTSDFVLREAGADVIELLAPASKTTRREFQHIDASPVNVTGARTLRLILEMDASRMYRSYRPPPFYLYLRPNHALLSTQQRTTRILLRRCFPIGTNLSSTIVGAVGASRFAVDGLFRERLVRGYTFRILPIKHSHRGPSHLHQLPANLLFEVAHKLWDANDCFEIMDARSILNMALVCKAWKPVTRVYFQKVGAHAGYIIHNFRGLARSLRYQPQMASCITSFSGHGNGVYYSPDLLNASRKFFASCPFLTDVKMPYWLYLHLKPVLSTITKIQRLSISDEWLKKTSNGHQDTVLELYTLSKKWPRLKTLQTCLYITGISPSPTQSTSTDPLEFSAPFSLTDLSLSGMRGIRNERMHINISRILYLLAPVSTLRSLHLSHFQGLSKNDIKRLLLSVSSTLEELFLNSCTVEPLSESEEGSIDVVIPHLKKIKFLRTSYPHATPLTLSRKSMESFCEFDWTMMDYKDYDEVSRALELTGWSRIQLYIRDAPRPDKVVEKHWHRVAKRKGITLIVDFTGTY